ncbi:hypothetical protein BDW74DRAFT_81041 [Aspergillus multicolor]|uniref:uncharacterized protein n=1 Tax=Aspergillus multicolor TaxID=41759 RepID=UPI003CCCD13D
MQSAPFSGSTPAQPQSCRARTVSPDSNSPPWRQHESAVASSPVTRELVAVAAEHPFCAIVESHGRRPWRWPAPELEPEHPRRFETWTQLERPSLASSATDWSQCVTHDGACAARPKRLSGSCAIGRGDGIHSKVAPLRHRDRGIDHYPVSPGGVRQASRRTEKQARNQERQGVGP